MGDFDYSDITTWHLGGFECDSCGGSCDSSAEFDPDWGDSGEWAFSYTVGCYSGDQIISTDENARELLQDMFVSLREASPRHWGSEQEFEVLELVETLGGFDL